MANMAGLDNLQASLNSQFQPGQGTMAGPQGQPPTSLNTLMPPDQTQAGGIPTPQMGGSPDMMGQGQPETPDLGQITLSDLFSMGLNALLTGLAHMSPPGSQPMMSPPPPGPDQGAMAGGQPPTAPPEGIS